MSAVCKTNNLRVTERKAVPEEVRSGPVEVVKDGLPWQAFAIVGERSDPTTWQLPHHSRLIFRAVKGKISVEDTVDWSAVSECARMLSPRGRDGERVHAGAEEVLDAARHLARHCVRAGRPLPDALAVLV